MLSFSPNLRESRRAQTHQVQADGSLEIDVRVVDLERRRSRSGEGGQLRARGRELENERKERRTTDLLGAPNLGRLVRIVGVDVEGELEVSVLVHSCKMKGRSASKQGREKKVELRSKLRDLATLFPSTPAELVDSKRPRGHPL